MLTCPECGRENPDGFTFCGFCTAQLTETSPAREQRKTVTVLFCDVTGSTELGERLDPEALRALLARYFERMRVIVERHGGTVEKFIGDAVMAVFGVPVVHEDDALRALRAAVEMRNAFPELGIQGRIGVTTGEVVAGTGERLATGDAVNVAARLEQAAQPGEILIGEATLRLARDAVEVEAVEPLALKGKSEPVAVHRLLSVHGEVSPARHLEAPMVGRQTELRRLGDAFDQAVRDRSCQLFTILGTAGVGKSRLAAEFLGSLQDALVVRGRCLPYGEGITYWPVAEVLKQLPQMELDPVAAGTIRGLLGEEQAVSSGDDIAWAFRKVLEAAASERPLVCVFDDIHWGEETFLDLIEHVADLSRDAPMLLLCMARPDLLDRRGGWAGGKVNATSVLLEPLGAEETERLIESLAHLDDDLRIRILEAAEGNPLYVEEMVALVQASGGGEISVPPTIQALLAARLDQLETSERDVLERGAVEGRVFHRSAVQALAPEEPQVVARLTSLVRKELVRPDRSELPGEDAFRFRHLLIRDAAYDGLPKATRAELHERFAGWLAEHGSGLVELDEILGYHLEQAWRYRHELGLPDDTGLAARGRLATAEHRAMARRDFGAAINLAGRTLALVPPGEVETVVEIELIDALFLSGQGEAGEGAIGAAVARAAAAGDRIAELNVRLEEVVWGALREPLGGFDRIAAYVEEVLPELEAAGDDLGLSTACWAGGWIAMNRGRMDAAIEAFERGVVHARRLPSRFSESLIGGALAHARMHGSTPVPELLDWLDAQPAAAEKRSSDQTRLIRARALAMVGRFDEARRLVGEVRDELLDRGNARTLAQSAQSTSAVEMLAGDPARAEEYLAESCEQLEADGAKGWLSTSLALRALALYDLDRLDEADECARKASEMADSDDMFTELPWRRARAKVLGRRGDRDAAERLAREAVAIADATDMLNNQGDAYADLAEVLEFAGRHGEATAALEEAVARFTRKGNVVSAQRVGERLAAEPAI